MAGPAFLPVNIQALAIEYELPVVITKQSVLHIFPAFQAAELRERLCHKPRLPLQDGTTANQNNRRTKFPAYRISIE